MSASSYSFDLPKDAPKGRPVDAAASGSTGHQDSASRLPFVNTPADGSAPPRAAQGRAGAQRGPNGRLLKDGHGGYDAVSGKWCHSAKNYAVMHHPDSDKPVPYDRPDYSQQPSISESLHARMCNGSNCPVPYLHQGQED